MATVASPTMKVPELAGLEGGRDALCFAALAQKSALKTKYGSPYWKCLFQDKHGRKEFMVWSDDPLHSLVDAWKEGGVYRLVVRAKSSQRGIDLRIIELREVVEDDTLDGFDISNLYETSRFDDQECAETVRGIARENIQDPRVLELVTRILDRYDAALRRMPAASSMHHAFTGGLLEHIRSVTRLAVYLAKHYGRYYDELNPPINPDVIVAAAILHDIGKLFELEYSPVSAKYTTPGCLIGHVVMGRDLVRKTAEEIEGFPAETLLQIDHAILSHHGKREFGAPVVPQTIEALIVSYADDIDAKINQMARSRAKSMSDDPFTEEIFFSGERRRIYKGVPRRAADGDDGSDE